MSSGIGVASVQPGQPPSPPPGPPSEPELEPEPLSEPELLPPPPPDPPLHAITELSAATPPTAKTKTNPCQLRMVLPLRRQTLGMSDLGEALSTSHAAAVPRFSPRNTTPRAWRRRRRHRRRHRRRLRVRDRASGWRRAVRKA